MRALGVAVVVLAGCISPVMQFGGNTAKQAQHVTLIRFTPPALVVDDEWRGEVRVARIRVWADDDFRAQNVRWQQAFGDELAYANEVLAGEFGVRLEAEYRVWHRHAPGATLADSLAALATEDPGDGVLSVVGLTSSLSLVSATFEQLGYASLPGRYAIVRGYADADERKVFDRAFPDLSAGERDALYQARRRHKTTAVLLHELGHNFGAAHQPIGETLMNATYSDRSASFDPASRAAIRATLDVRLHRGSAAEPRSSFGNAPPATTDEHTSLVIVIDAAGRTLVGNVAIDQATLDGLLAMSFDDDPQTQVVVRSSAKAPRGAVDRLVAEAKTAGLQRVAIEVGDLTGEAGRAPP